MIQRIDISSARLRIRHFEERDLEACIDFRRRVFGLDEAEDKAKGWLRWTIDSYRELAGLGQPPYSDYAIVELEGGAFVGSIGIVPTVLPWGALQGDEGDALLSPEVGLFWGVLPELRRRGYATEAACAVLDFLFDALKLRQVVATTEHDNLASRRVMRKLGMRLLRNPQDKPAWCQVVGVMTQPQWNACLKGL